MLIIAIIGVIIGIVKELKKKEVRIDDKSE